MPRKPNLRDLAKQLAVSPTTVSEALRGLPRVNTATRERVRRAGANSFHAELVAGARRRAAALGFKMDRLGAEAGRMSREQGARRVGAADDAR